MSETYVDAVEWARNVGEQNPHGLLDVEDVVLSTHPENKARLSRTGHVRVGAKEILGVLAYGVAACAPLAGPGAFAVHVWRRPGYTLDVESAFPQASIAFLVSCAFLVGLFAAWWRRGRYRDGVAIGLSLLTIGCGALTLVRANEFRNEFDGDPTIHLVPVWAAIVIATAVVLCHAFSAADPQRNRTGTANLTDGSRAMLLAEREAALRVLAEREMLSDGDVDALSARPLGELHLPEEEQRER